MKRALILIVTLSVLTFGGGLWLDHLQQQTAMTYLDQLALIRTLITEDDMEAAIGEQAKLHAGWQKDAHWLNVLLDHHHTRDVESALRHLATSLQEKNRMQALLAMDEVVDAFEEVAQRDMAVWENIM